MLAPMIAPLVLAAVLAALAVLGLLLRRAEQVDAEEQWWLSQYDWNPFGKFPGDEAVMVYVAPIHGAPTPRSPRV